LTALIIDANVCLDLAGLSAVTSRGPEVYVRNRCVQKEINRVSKEPREAALQTSEQPRRPSREVRQDSDETACIEYRVAVPNEGTAASSAEVVERANS
jgi:hypothetical protein